MTSIPTRARRLALLATAAALVPAAGAHAATPTTSVVNRVLVVQGTASNDRITLRSTAAAPDQLLVDTTSDGTVDKTIAQSAIDRIDVHLADGLDELIVNTAPGGVGALPTTVAGDGGNDLLRVLGGAGADAYDVGGFGAKVAIRRPGQPNSVDADVEDVMVQPGAGTDTVGVGNLAGAAVHHLAVLLTDADDVPDAAVDDVTVSGTGGTDNLSLVDRSSRDIGVSGTPLPVDILAADSTDKLRLAAGEGNDTLFATAFPADRIRLTLDGGGGNDSLAGTTGKDTVVGGSGNDSVFQPKGPDVTQLGAGNDRFFWTPGAGSQSVDGQDGLDVLDVTGANIAERFALKANGTRLRLTRNIANVVLDAGTFEETDVHALGGPDTVAVRKLAGTGVRSVIADLRSSTGGPDGVADSIFVDSTAATTPPIITATAGSGTAIISDDTKTVGVSGSDGIRDHVTIDTGDKDLFDVSNFDFDTIGLSVF
jgi:Ca2+-binding RTX toxin-like protein